MLVCFVKVEARASAWVIPMNYFMVVSGLWFTSVMALIVLDSISFTKFFHKVSRFSYTLYIVHFPVMLFVFGVWQNAIVGSRFNAFLIAVVTVFGCTVLAYFMSKVLEDKKLFLAVVHKLKAI